MTHYLTDFLTAAQQDMIISLLQKFDQIEIDTRNLPGDRVDFKLTFARHMEKYSFIWNSHEQIPGPASCFISQGCVLAMGNTEKECVKNFLVYLDEQITKDYENDLRVIVSQKEPFDESLKYNPDEWEANSI